MTTDPSWLRLDRQLCFRLYAGSRALNRAYQPLLAPLGLTYPQYLAMLVLWESDGISVKCLGERLRLDSGTLTPLLKRLETAGLVSRQRNPDDERELVVRLTDTGKALYTQALDVPPKLLSILGMNLDELEQLTRLLDKLLARVASDEGRERCGLET